MSESPEQRLARLQAAEEAQRASAAKNHRFPCVPWRGAGGDLGRCIYCGAKKDQQEEQRLQDIITSYYADRANGVHANRAC